MNIYSKEVQRFIDNATISGYDFEAKYADTVIPMNINFTNNWTKMGLNLVMTEIRGNRKFVYEGIPVILCYCEKLLGETTRNFVPGVHIMGKVFDKNADETFTEDVRERVFYNERILTRMEVKERELIGKKSRDSRTSQEQIFYDSTEQLNQENTDLLKFQDFFSDAMENYLTGNRVGTLDSFSNLICFQPEVDKLSYVEKDILTLLCNVNIGTLLAEYSSKQPVQEILKFGKVDSLDSLSKLTGEITFKELKERSHKVEEGTTPTTKLEDETFEGLSEVVRNYFKGNRRVFSIFSSLNRDTPLTTAELRFSSIEESTLDNYAFNEGVDPVNVKAKLEGKDNDMRTLGQVSRVIPGSNATGLLPVFNKLNINHMIVGNVPLMLISSTEVDNESINDDPIYFVKRYMLNKGEKLVNDMKNSGRVSKLSPEERHIIDNETELINIKDNNYLYCNKIGSVNNIRRRKPEGLSYKKVYKLAFINLPTLLAISKSNDEKFNTQFNNLLNKVLPIDM